MLHALACSTLRYTARPLSSVVSESEAQQDRSATVAEASLQPQTVPRAQDRRTIGVCMRKRHSECGGDNSQLAARRSIY